MILLLAALAARTEPIEASAWEGSEWISVPGTEIVRYDGNKHSKARAADGTSWFFGRFRNDGDVVSAKWMATGLGVFDIHVNGVRVGEDFLKPGFTHCEKTRYSFTYDIVSLIRTEAGAENDFAVEVSSGWWRDKIVNFKGERSAFRGVIELRFSDGSVRRIGSNTRNWRCGIVGPVTHAAIFDGEEFDARIPAPVHGEGLEQIPERNREFNGEILPTAGAEVVLRRDLAMRPAAAYCWKDVEGVGLDRDGKPVFGKVVKTRSFPSDALVIEPGETLIVDFGQNCAAVPEFRFRAAHGVTLTALPAEMLNDSNGERSRGNDGPAGSVYRENLRCPDTGMRMTYTFAGLDAGETFLPRFTFFGYRYLSVTASGRVEIQSLRSVPVTSITKEMEIGRIETGDRDVNRLISNVYWGQLSNYLSVPTDCPQRNERLGWSADTQVFCEAGAFNANTAAFFRKWTRDLRDSRDAEGGYPCVAPTAQYGDQCFSLGWGDAGVIVPYTVWLQFGDNRIIDENFDAMAKFVRKLDETKYDFEGKLAYIYADWLSYEKFETCGNAYGSQWEWNKHPDAMNYRRFLAACYWLYDARLLSEMAAATGRDGEAAWFRDSAGRALAYIRSKFVEKDGLLLRPMRDIQTACVFALRHGIVEGSAREATLRLLTGSIRAHGDCLQTGFLGTSFLMDALTECGCADVAYTLLLQRRNPSWLYSVDQGATTIWERWNSYRKDSGFGPVSMNSFNHYAYGAVLAWIYKTVAGIAPDSRAPGFRNIIMKPVPDRRLGSVKAEYRTPQGLVRSTWHYEGDRWIWEFSIPAGVTADVTVPGASVSRRYEAGDHRVELFASETTGATRAFASGPHVRVSPAGPVKTPAAALAQVRELRAAGAIRRDELAVVEFAEGTYRLDQPLVFGSGDDKIWFSGAPDHGTVFSGGVELPPFAVGKDGVWRTKVPHGFRIEQLWVNGRRATLAKTPNKGYYYIRQSIPGKEKQVFVGYPEEVSAVAGLDASELADVIFRVWWSWEQEECRIAGLDAGKGTMTLAEPLVHDFFKWPYHETRYQLENYRAALDMPGEFYLDRKSGELLYMPRPGEKIATARAVVPRLERLMIVEGANDVTFDGVAFAHARWLAGRHFLPQQAAAAVTFANVEVSNASDVRFDGCLFEHLSAYALWFRRGTHDCSVVRSLVRDGGSGGVRIGLGSGEWDELNKRKALESAGFPSRIVVDNNILTDLGRVHPEGCGVYLSFARDCQISHNEICDLFYTGVSLGWSWGYAESGNRNNVVAWNHIHHLGKGVLSDMGGVYTLGVNSNTCVTCNHVHDVFSYGYTGSGGCGLYQDMGSTDIRWTSNLVHHTKTAGINMNFGRDNTFVNNIIAYPLKSDQPAVARVCWKPSRSISAFNNVFVVSDGQKAFWSGWAYDKKEGGDKWQDIAFNSNLWWCAGSLKKDSFNEANKDPGTDWEGWRAHGMDADGVFADPIFRNAAKGDWHLKPGSPAFGIGYREWGYPRCGVYGDSKWVGLARRIASQVKPFEPIPVPRKYVQPKDNTKERKDNANQ